ncbi:thiol-disulfide isomerase/thioredoxin [Chryseobacterium sp. 52]|uniref:TlpA family protein disulfide reductase n=1 Tax=Chryseobacterium sp. 52 TaxID=2035213 RepID=UPI000C18CDFB|nr:TlpA disulfide reductase family protein [Chryseobacterium sp. 52]PIF45650.1 thiol-disulfide isomerase/thioredoxin [Chryseobacterium sp. 52]
MKKIFLVLSFLVHVIGFGQGIRENQPVPKFSVKNEKGTLKSSDLKGKVVLINFFATWCGPCLKELPHLQKEVWEKYKDNKKFSLLVIGREHSQNELIEFKARKGFDLPFYPDKDRSVYSLFAKESIPRNYIVDAKGNVVYSSMGFNEEEFKRMVEKIDELLK